MWKWMWCVVLLGLTGPASATGRIGCWNVKNQDVVLTTQAEVDALGRDGDHCFKRYLRLRGKDIRNLEALRSVREVRWLEIVDTSITDLEGLWNLQMIDAITLDRNRLLTSLSGLGPLAESGLTLKILNHPALETLKGLEEVRILEGLTLINAPALRDLSALGGLEALGSLVLSGNASLPRCAAQGLVDRMGDANIDRIELSDLDANGTCTPCLGGQVSLGESCAPELKGVRDLTPELSPNLAAIYGNWRGSRPQSSQVQLVALRKINDLEMLALELEGANATCRMRVHRLSRIDENPMLEHEELGVACCPGQEACELDTPFARLVDYLGHAAQGDDLRPYVHPEGFSYDVYTSCEAEPVSHPADASVPGLYASEQPNDSNLGSILLGLDSCDLDDEDGSAVCAAEPRTFVLRPHAGSLYVSHREWLCE